MTHAPQHATMVMPWKCINTTLTHTCAVDMMDGDGAHEEEEEDAGPMEGAVVLHEDKKYYPTAEEVYGPGTTSMQHYT